MLTSGEILRKEPNAFHTELPASLGFTPEVYFRTSKKVAVMTRNPNCPKLLSNPVFYNELFKTLILTEPEHSALAVPPGANVTSIENLSLRTAIEHL